MKQIGNYLLIALLILFTLIAEGSELITNTFSPEILPWARLIGYIFTTVAAAVGVRNEYLRLQKKE